MIEFWSCSCVDKRNAKGVPRCRKCGVCRPTYSTDGESIIVTREKPTTPAKPRKSRNLPPVHDGENFTQSTMQRNKDK